MEKDKITKYQYDNDYHIEDSKFESDNCIIYTRAFSSGEMKIHHSISVSRGDEFINIISGNTEKEVIDLLFTAVNNRTRERNYFKLYCDLLDGTITEEQFDEEIAKKESDYIVDESEDPSLYKVSLAIKLAKHIKDVDSINDLSSLFSFNPKSIEKLAIE
jgi:hypothetical protein